jgi:hypothetical protein
MAGHALCHFAQIPSDHRLPVDLQYFVAGVNSAAHICRRLYLHFADDVHSAIRRLQIDALHRTVVNCIPLSDTLPIRKLASFCAILPYPNRLCTTPADRPNPQLCDRKWSTADRTATKSIRLRDERGKICTLLAILVGDDSISLLGTFTAFTIDTTKSII